MGLQHTAALLIAAPLFAQAGASENVFLAGQDRATGGAAQSASFRAHVVVSTGMTLGTAASSSFKLEGGLAATFDAPVVGRPWLVGARPVRVLPVGGPTLELFGTELDLGASPSLSIGGQVASITGRAHHRLMATCPAQPTPGWVDARFASSAGATDLGQACGVLPMLTTETTPAPDEPFTLVFQGTPNDTAILALGIGTGPPIRLGAIRYGLALNPAVLVILAALPIPATGEFRLPVPAAAWVGPLYAQALFANSGSPYAPGSFSNVLVFR
ncbi:MAG: hypothetical protein KDC87_14285 [Planctomycetes bacterium]|nr:hypothetical protein [Planctomycetota bacterium]